jgi:hypothetical protein
MSKSMPSRDPVKVVLAQEAEALVQQFLDQGGQILTVDHSATNYPYNEPRKVEPNGRAKRVAETKKR